MNSTTRTLIALSQSFLNLKFKSGQWECSVQYNSDRGLLIASLRVLLVVSLFSIANQATNGL